MANRIDCLGRPTIAALAQRAGGLTIAVPYVYTPGTRLDHLLGHNFLTLLIDNFSGERIYIPKGPSDHNSRKNPIPTDRVFELIRASYSIDQISHELNCSSRAIQKIRARIRDLGK